MGKKKKAGQPEDAAPMGATADGGPAAPHEEAAANSGAGVTMPSQSGQTQAQPPWLISGLTIVLAVLVVIGTLAALFKGSEFTPTGRQLIMLFGAVFATTVLYVGASTGAFYLDAKGVRIRLKGAVGAGAAIYVLLVVVAPKPVYRAAGIHLDHAGQPLSRSFRAIIRVAGLNPIIIRGDNGSLLFQIPSHIDQLESVSVEDCAGYRISDRQKWPAKLENGNLHIIMVKTQDGPPPSPPPDHFVVDRPSEAESKATLRVKPDEARFQYKNLTDSDMRLFLFGFSRLQEERKSPLSPNSPWLGGWPFPAKDEFQHFQEFNSGNGWFSIFVICDDRTSPAGSHVFPLRNWRLNNKNLFNLFEHRLTSLVVTESGDKNNPFEAVVTWED